MRISLASFAVAAALFAAAPASAATINVNVTGDAADPNPGNNTCDTGVGSPNGQCTLRAAVQTANFDNTADTIVLPAGTYTRTLTTTNENAAAQGDLDITTPVTIDGAGVNSTFVDAAGHDRVFDVLSGGQLLLSNLVVENGAIDSFVGGGIQSIGTLSLDHVVVTGNTSSGSTAGGNGGGIYNSGNFTAIDSSITSNHATGGLSTTGYGGGIYNGGGMSLNRVLVANNTAVRTGGGLTQANPSATIVSSTFSGNSAALGGGAMSTFSSSGNYAATVTWTTIVGNSSTSGAPALTRSDQNTTPWTFGSSIIAGNTSGDSSPQCATAALIQSNGHNIIGDASCGTAATGDQKSTDPNVGALADNGGPTLTRLPNPGSPAIDNGDTSGCPLVDQRGVARPIGSACDVGAVEAPLPVVPPPPPTPSPSSVVVDPVSVTRKPGDPNTVTATVTRTDGSVAANTEVHYVIAGVNPGSGVVTTDATGKAAISWDGVHDGTDTVTAFVDLNGDGTPDGTDASAQAIVHWVLPVPVIAKTVNVEPLSGKVLVKLPSPKTGKVSAAASYIPLQEAKNLPIGTIVDARKGHVELNSATKKGSSKTQTGEFYSGAFEMTQSSTSPYMEVAMSEALVCPKSGKSRVTAARATSRHLWGSDKGGKFRTRGRHSTATVRGTTWYSKDTCTSTTTVVREGTVIVTDFAKHKHVTVKAGHRYVAHAAKTG